jgi:hypothetical protein
VIYLAETDFARLDLYCSLALALGLEPTYRCASLWREIKPPLSMNMVSDGKSGFPEQVI